MGVFSNNFLLRLALALVFLSHSLHGIFTGNDVNNFGNFFLNKIGFAPLGVPIAWTVVLLQVFTSILLLVNRYIRMAALVNIAILIMGIALVHYRDGWFVVGGGRNGMEYSVVLIFVLLSLAYPSGLFRKAA